MSVMFSLNLKEGGKKNPIVKPITPPSKDGVAGRSGMSQILWTSGRVAGLPALIGHDLNGKNTGYFIDRTDGKWRLCLVNEVVDVFSKIEDAQQHAEDGLKNSTERGG